MKRTGATLFVLAAISIFAALAAPAGALPVPQLSGHVNDYARMISPAAAQGLERELTKFETSNSTQIVVLTIPGLKGEALEDFSIKVAESWKIGHKDIDNGVIFLVAKDDRKVRIEVGRGLEGKLTDLIAGRIVRNVVIPRFRTGDFDGGITAGVSSIMEIVRGEYTGRPSREPASGTKRCADLHPSHLPLRHPRFCGRPFQDSRRSSGGHRPSCRRKALLSCPRPSGTGRHRGRRGPCGPFCPQPLLGGQAKTGRKDARR